MSPEEAYALLRDFCLLCDDMMITEIVDRDGMSHNGNSAADVLHEYIRRIGGKENLPSYIATITAQDRRTSGAL